MTEGSVALDHPRHGYYLLSQFCNDCEVREDRGMRLALYPPTADVHDLDGWAVVCLGCLAVKREATGRDIADVNRGETA